MRVSEVTQYRNLLREVERAQERIQDAQMQIASGKRVNRPSDDPSSAVDIVRILGDREIHAQLQKNVGYARARLGHVDSVLEGVENVVGRIRELGYSSQGSLANPANFIPELQSLQDQLFLSGNSVFQGQFIFGGTQITTPPYTRQPDGSAVYTGNSTATKLQIGMNQQIDVQIPGNQIFNAAVDIFTTVRDLITAVQAEDHSATDAQLKKIESFMDTLSTARSRAGALMNATDRAEQLNTTSGIETESELSRAQAADLAKAISELNLSETQLDATLSAGARTARMSLLDYLR